MDLHRRLAIIVPDQDFADNLKLKLKEKLKKENLCIICAKDSVKTLNRTKPTPNDPSKIILDTVQEMSGLESLIVFGVGLDKSILSEDGDLYKQHHQVKSLVYQAMTRAHLKFSFINEKVKGGWLEWLEYAGNSSNSSNSSSNSSNSSSNSSNSIIDTKNEPNQSDEKETTGNYENNKAFEFSKDIETVIDCVNDKSSEKNTYSQAASFSSPIFDVAEGEKKQPNIIRFNPAGKIIVPYVQLPVPPGQCTVMVSFHHTSTGSDTVELTNYLTLNGIKTFCVDVWCPHPIGDNWQVATTEGVIACKYFVMLMNNGWQKSKNCQHKCRSALQRQINKEITIIPVVYKDFDPNYDRKEKQFWFNNLGATQRASSKDQSPNDWMEKIRMRIINNSLG